MKKGFKLDDIPKEVLYIQMMEASPFPWYVGIDEYNRVEAIKKKYPEHFPWHAKYNSIPKEVHDAYRNEVNPGWNKPLVFDDIPYGNGIEAQINECGNTPSSFELTTKDVANIFKDFIEASSKRDEEARKEKERIKKIWDKHYKKYNLSYRE